MVGVRRDERNAGRKNEGLGLVQSGWRVSMMRRVSGEMLISKFITYQRRLAKTEDGETD